MAEEKENSENTEKQATKAAATAAAAAAQSTVKPRYVPVPFHLRERPETPEKE